METDTEMLARLERMVKRSHPSEWTREAFPGDVEAIRRALALIDKYRGALNNLTKQLDLVHIHPQYQGIWQMAFIHGMIYTGPTYTAELEAARAALAPEPAPEGEVQSGQD